MSVSVTTGRLTLNELVCMFAGENDDYGSVSEPCYTVPLALEIAKRCDPTSEVDLRRRFYGDWPTDQIPQDARDAIGLAYQRYRQERAWLR